MSRPPFIKTDKNVFVTPSIPDKIKDDIRSIVNSGEYGKLENLLTDSNIKVPFTELNLNTSLLHGVIQSSSLTKTQKYNISNLLIQRGIAVDILDEKGFTPIYYAIKDQDFNLVRLLIDNHAKLNKKIDYFQVALQPHANECRSQLFTVQDQAMMSKYYSQQLDIERNFRTEINKFPITLDIIQYLLDFVGDLPNKEVVYYNGEDNTVKTSRNIRLEGDGDELKEFIPEFENKLFQNLNEIANDLNQFLRQGQINEDQISSKKIEIVQKIQEELKKQLEYNSINTIPGLKSNFIYDPTKNTDQLYSDLFTPHEYNMQRFPILFRQKYRGVQEQIIREFNQYVGNLKDEIEELIELEHNLSVLYPIFKPIANNEVPTLESGTIFDKKSSRLFYERNANYSNDNLLVDINNFHGGKIQKGGAISNKLTNIINMFSTELRKTGINGGAGPGGFNQRTLLNDNFLYNNCYNELLQIFNDQPQVGNPQAIIGPGVLEGPDRDNMVTIQTLLGQINNLLTNISTKGSEINTEINQSRINNINIDRLFDEYNTLMIQFNNYYISYATINNNNAYGHAFDLLDNYIVSIFNNLSDNNLFPAQQPFHIFSNQNNYNPLYDTLLNNHIYYNKIIPTIDNTLNELNDQLIFQNNSDSNYEVIDKFRKTIFIINYFHSFIKHLIVESKLKDQIDNDYDDLDQLNQNITNILPPNSVNSQNNLKLELKNKFQEVESTLIAINRANNANTKRFNSFIIELNNLSESGLLYEKYITQSKREINGQNLLSDDEKFILNQLDPNNISAIMLAQPVPNQANIQLGLNAGVVLPAINIGAIQPLVQGLTQDQIIKDLLILHPINQVQVLNLLQPNIIQNIINDNRITATHAIEILAQPTLQNIAGFINNINVQKQESIIQSLPHITSGSILVDIQVNNNPFITGIDPNLALSSINNLSLRYYKNIIANMLAANPVLLTNQNAYDIISNILFSDSPLALSCIDDPANITVINNLPQQNLREILNDINNSPANQDADDLINLIANNIPNVLFNNNTIPLIIVNNILLANAPNILQYLTPAMLGNLPLPLAQNALNTLNANPAALNAALGLIQINYIANLPAPGVPAINVLNPMPQFAIQGLNPSIALSTLAGNINILSLIGQIEARAIINSLNLANAQILLPLILINDLLNSLFTVSEVILNNIDNIDLDAVIELLFTQNRTDILTRINPYIAKNALNAIPVNNSLDAIITIVNDPNGMNSFMNIPNRIFIPIIINIPPGDAPTILSVLNGILATLPNQYILQILENIRVNNGFDQIIDTLRTITQANPNSNIYSNHNLSLNNPFILYKPENRNYPNEYDNLANISTHEERLSYYTNNVNNIMMYNNPLMGNDYNFRLFTPGNPPAQQLINPDLDLNNFLITPPQPPLAIPPQPYPYNILYLPDNNKILNLQIITVMYHEKVFKQLLSSGNQIYTTIRNDFIQKNPSIQLDQIDKLLFKILDDSIKNNIKELVNITLFFAANRLVANRLLNNPQNLTTNQTIANILNEKSKKRLDRLQRDQQQQEFYLDENYSSSEPIDMIPCINNDVNIINILIRKMNINPKEYQDLIFKLGNVNILNAINTRNKITRVDLTRYLQDHSQKFDRALVFLQEQVEQTLKDSIFNTNGEFAQAYIAQIYGKNNQPPVLRVNANDRNCDFIYDDLINQQRESNAYLYERIYTGLDILFTNALIPQVEHFLEFFSEQELLPIPISPEEIKVIIDNIIYYHLKIDPTKSKEKEITLEDSVVAFGNLFTNPLAEANKVTIVTIYNDRLKPKLIDTLTQFSKYYLTVYNNYLKYLFNYSRYNRLI